MVARVYPIPTPQLGFSLSADPVRAAFQRRSLEALARIAELASTATLAEALAATTDIGTLARVLGDATVVGPAVVELEPLAPLIARNAEHRLELLEAAGGAHSAEEVGILLGGISRQAVDKRRQSHGLLAFRQGGDWRYPACQFDRQTHDVVPGVPVVVRAMADSGPWVTLDFLLAADERLDGMSPLDALRAGGHVAEIERLLRVEAGDGFA